MVFFVANFCYLCIVRHYADNFASFFYFLIHFYFCYLCIARHYVDNFASLREGAQGKGGERERRERGQREVRACVVCVWCVCGVCVYPSESRVVCLYPIDNVCALQCLYPTTSLPYDVCIL
jgi:hypothetical protein